MAGNPAMFDLLARQNVGLLWQGKRMKPLGFKGL